MSVYTILKNKDVRRILSSYDIGTLQSFRGISEGITNTNYFIMFIVISNKELINVPEIKDININLPILTSSTFQIKYLKVNF